MKKGFTLAEILVTLGIVGVVAAMTIPHIQTSVLKQQVGPRLMRAINTIENAIQLSFTQEDVNKFYEFSNKNVTELFEEYVEPVMKGSKGSFSSFKYYTNFDQSSSNHIQVTTSAKIFTTPDGMQFFGPTSGSLSTCTGSKCTKYFYIDVNGNSTPPNALGRDLFQMLLMEDGSVVAKGAENDWTTGATSKASKTCNKTEVKNNGYYCAGAIYDNGGKVTYKW